MPLTEDGKTEGGMFQQQCGVIRQQMRRENINRSQTAN